MRRGNRGGARGGGRGVRWFPQGYARNAVPDEVGVPSSGGAVDELEVLKLQEQDLESRLQELKEQIGRAERGIGRERRVASVDSSMCTRCGRCVQICPAEAVMIRGTAVGDADKCVGCGRCVQICPKGAITLKDRKESV